MDSLKEADDSYKELKKEQIISHLRGNAENTTDVIGVFPLLPDDTCRFIVFDFDNHGKDAEKNDFVNADDLWKEEVDSLRKICDINGIDALAERSRSGRAHIYGFSFKNRLNYVRHTLFLPFSAYILLSDSKQKSRHPFSGFLLSANYIQLFKILLTKYIVSILFIASRS